MKAYPWATQYVEDALLYFVSIMGMLGGLLRTKIAQLLDSPLKMQSQNGCKQKEHVVC
jgi:hypothetical protein